MKKILLAASECVPFIKTGGLADVVGSLPKYFDPERFDARVILPCYLCIPDQYRSAMEDAGHFYMNYNGRDRYVGIRRLLLDGVQFYFIDNEEYFSGAGPYTDMAYDIEKFGFFSKAVLSVLPTLGFHPDVIHCNDWHTGLIPVYLKTIFSCDSYYASIRSVMTIHNLRFQGIWNIDDIKRMTGLPDRLFTFDQLEYYGNANYLKGGIVFADAVTTVSDTYAQEVLTPRYGEGLQEVLRYHAGKFSGIVNGIDFGDYDPASDPALRDHYDASSFRSGKAANKAALQEALALAPDRQALLIGMVSRITDQKGFDLLDEALEQMPMEHIQLAVLGTGEPRYEDMLRRFEARYPGRVSANIFYSEALSRRIYGGCDAFLMPSLFEPCGLSQLISLRYGTLPIVRSTGGLKDTVTPFGESPDCTGFAFTDCSAAALCGAVREAQQLFLSDKKTWNQMVRRAMACDYSWHSSAGKYQTLYERVAGNV